MRAIRADHEQALAEALDGFFTGQAVRVAARLRRSSKATVSGARLLPPTEDKAMREVYLAGLRPAVADTLALVDSRLGGPTGKTFKYSEDQPRDERGRFGEGSGQNDSLPSLKIPEGFLPEVAKVDWTQTFDGYDVIQNRSADLMANPTTYDPSSTADAQAAYFMNQVRESPVRTSFRGMRLSPDEAKAFQDKYPVGSTIMFPLSSFGDAGLARIFAKHGMGRPLDENDVPVFLTARGPYFEIDSREGIMAGRFQVAAIRQETWQVDYGEGSASVLLVDLAYEGVRAPRVRTG